MKIQANSTEKGVSNRTARRTRSRVEIKGFIRWQAANPPPKQRSYAPSAMAGFTITGWKKRGA